MSRRSFRTEAGPMFRLALPVVLGELGWMAMPAVDSMIVGRLGAEPLGAVSIGRSALMICAIFGIGLLYGLDTLISQAFGAKLISDTRRYLIQGLWIAAIATPVTMIAMLVVDAQLPRFGIAPEIRSYASQYIRAVLFAVPSLFAYTALRRYLQAVGRARTVMFALISANLVNLLADWILVFGRLGFEPRGIAGAGIATALALGYMALFMLVALVWQERGPQNDWTEVSWKPDRSRLKRLIRIGLPSALQIVLEIGVFTVATFLVGSMDAISLGAHQVALTLASITFMVPQGISAAGAVRVGHALGRRDPQGAADSGWMALLFGAVAMGTSALAFCLFPRTLARLFTPDAEVVALSGILLVVAGLFQLFDGVQVVATGILRGAGDTKSPMIWSLVTHWTVGLPVAWWLGFRAGYGVLGIWIGLCTGLILVGSILLRVWVLRVRRLQETRLFI